MTVIEKMMSQVQMEGVKRIRIEKKKGRKMTEIQIKPQKEKKRKEEGQKKKKVI